MNKVKVLPWICLVILLFSGCAEKSDGKLDQAPKSIEEEKQIQDAPLPVLTKNEGPEMQVVQGTYCVENRVVFAFKDEGIVDGEEVVGQYMEGVPYLYLPAMMERFGWVWTDSGKSEIQKDELQFQFENNRVQRIFLDERGSPYGLQFPLVFEGERIMLAQTDFETLFGLQSSWDPETRMLSLIEWEWELPEQVATRVEGDEAYVILKLEINREGVDVLDGLPGIRIRSNDGERFSQGASGHSEEDIYVIETRSGVLTPGVEWSGIAWVYYRGKPLATYPLDLAFDKELDNIQIFTGPWIDFTLDSQTRFYTMKQEVLVIKGTTEDDWVSFAIEELQEEHFVPHYDESMDVVEGFEWCWAPQQPGIYRIQVRSGKDGISMDRARFYYEKE